MLGRKGKGMHGHGNASIDLRKEGLAIACHLLTVMLGIACMHDWCFASLLAAVVGIVAAAVWAACRIEWVA